MNRLCSAALISLGLSAPVCADGSEAIPPILQLPLDIAVLVGAGSDDVLERLEQQFPDHRVRLSNMVAPVDDEMFWVIEGTLRITQDPVRVFGLSCTQYGIATRDYFGGNTDLTALDQIILIEASVRADDMAVWPEDAGAVLNCTTTLVAPTSDTAIDLDEAQIDRVLAEYFAVRVWQDDPLGLRSDTREVTATEAARGDAVFFESAIISLQGIRVGVQTRSFARVGGV